MPVPQIVKDIEELMKKRYTQPPGGEEQAVLDGIARFVAHIQLRRSSRNLFQEAAKALHMLFPFQEITIGTLSPDDRRYHYEYFLGYTHDAEVEFKKHSYSEEEFFSQREFPSIRITKQLDLNISENMPQMEGEKACWNRPSKLKDARDSPDKFLEGDYLDVYVYNADNEMVAWLELSAPRDGNMPSAAMLKGLELFASVLGIALQALTTPTKDIPAKR